VGRLLLAVLVAAARVSACSATHHSAASKGNTTSSSPRPRATTTTPAQRGSLSGISFEYPAGLHVDRIPVDEHYTQIIGYVSNEHLHQPCATTQDTTGTTTRCGWPLEHLSPGGVLVTWSFSLAPGRPTSSLMSVVPGAATVVDGRPAKLYITSEAGTVASDCYGLGAAVFVEGIVRPPGANNAPLFMRACLGRRALGAQRAIVAMLKSVRFTS
jgi:hypothetical protein